MNILSADISGLTVPNPPDLRRDIHRFVDYVRTREIKRSYRGNDLSQADKKRLTSLLSSPDPSWLKFIDRITLKLDFVSYDTEGVYVGYSSQEPVFQDNHVKFQQKEYDQFLELTTNKQEFTLREILSGGRQQGHSEFFSPSVLGRLDQFYSFGCATGIIPTIDFVPIRRFLLKILAECPSDLWLSTESLIAYIKEAHPFFLIPDKYLPEKRYQNFREGPISSDSFERVEGRYIERFLEGVPLELKYVDLAYEDQERDLRTLSLGRLKAFRVNPLLRQALKGELLEPKVTVTRDFEVHIQSNIYPASSLNQLLTFCEEVQQDVSIILKLTKQKVAAAYAANDQLDIVGVLQSLAHHPLPDNVTSELLTWKRHGEKFILFSGFSLLEAESLPPSLKVYEAEPINARCAMVRHPEVLFNHLEQLEKIPIRVKHWDQAFAVLPLGFKKKPEPKTKITLQREYKVQLVCPNETFFIYLSSVLRVAKSPVDFEPKQRILSFYKKDEPDVMKAIKGLSSQYEVKYAS